MRRLTIRLTATFVALAGALASEVAAAEIPGQPAPSSLAPPPASAPARANPYRRLFQQPVPPTPAAPDAASQPRPKTRVVCGMVTIEADPGIDRGIARPVPTGEKFTIRAVEPTVCR